MYPWAPLQISKNAIDCHQHHYHHHYSQYYQYISYIYHEAPPHGRICMKYGTDGRLADVIDCVKFFGNQFNCAFQFYGVKFRLSQHIMGFSALAMMHYIKLTFYFCYLLTRL